MAVLTGVIGSEGLVSTNVKRTVDSVLKKLEPYQHPFLSWLMLMKKDGKVVKNAYGKFEWFERDFVPHHTQVSAAITESSGLTLTASNVDDVTFFNIGDIVLIEATGEMAYVSSGTVGTSVILTPISGSGSLSSLTSAHLDSFIKIIGSRNLEYTATSGRLSMIQKEELKYNYLNIFKKKINTSGRQEAGEMYTDGLSHDELVEQAILELKGEIERYLFFAPERGYATSGNERFTYGYGLEGIISTNVVSYAGDLTESGFDSYLHQVYKRGGNRKLHMAGSEQMEDIEKFMKDRYQLYQQPGQKSIWSEYGIESKSYRTFNGVTTLVWNPILDGKYEDYGFTIDEKWVRLRFMAPDKKGARRFRVRPIDIDESDGTLTEILFDLGLEVGAEAYHGKLYKAA
jgi:hypothetical protein